MHSHLLPGLDDGVVSLEKSKEVILRLQSLGYSKLITTPHIMSDSYRNSPETILPALEQLKSYLVNEGVGINISAAAEYYLDDSLMTLMSSNDQLLTFGSGHFLFETNYLSEPYALKDFIFKATSKGYRPILAHPERYQYMTLEKAEDIMNRGVILQVNMLSLSGFYGKPIQKMAEKLIEKKWIGVLGSDCHSILHAQALDQVLNAPAFKKALDLPLLNFTL